MLCTSLLTGGGGWLLVRHAQAMRPPAEPTGRTIAGTVTEVVTETCGSGNRRRTCYRPVVSYVDGGETRQIVSRTAYRPSPHEKGDPAPVLVLTTGEAWMAAEWEARRDRRLDDFQRKRGFPLTMGWLLVGCAAFGVLLAAGLVFFVDRSSEPGPA